MTREECENRLLELIQEADRVYHEYKPDGVHLSLYAIDGYYHASDAIRDENGDYTTEHTVRISKFENGTVCR